MSLNLLGMNGGRRRGRCGWRRFCGLSARRGWGVGRGSSATSWGICRGAFEQLRILSIRCWSRRRCAGWWGRWFAPVWHGGCAILLPALRTIELMGWYFARYFALGREGSDSIYKEDGIRLIIQLSNRLTAHSTEYATAWPLNQSVAQAIDWLVEVLTNQVFNQSTG